MNRQAPTAALRGCGGAMLHTPSKKTSFITDNWTQNSEKIPFLTMNVLRGMRVRKNRQIPCWNFEVLSKLLTGPDQHKRGETQTQA